jgi:hypothetical protein
MNGIGDGIGTLIFGLIGLCIIFVPLGAWKAIEIIYWIWSHIHWGTP